MKNTNRDIEEVYADIEYLYLKLKTIKQTETPNESISILKQIIEAKKKLGIDYEFEEKAIKQIESLEE